MVFELDGDELVLDSEVVLLEIPTQRRACCHSGGALAFGPDGNLYIGVGDNTNPFDSDGFSPLDERPDRRDWDAQRTAANSADLRGKILRIKPQDDGSYSIPPGNLFAEAEEGRPEIYVMGVRNPFRLSIDHKNGWLYWGDVGPDARQADPQRGPIGLDEWNQARAAGNFGWPYCIGDNQPYVAYDFATESSGTPFDCGTPMNLSPNNTGLQSLPPAQAAWVWYPYGTSSAFPEIIADGGRTALAGPVYYYDAAAGSKKLPAYYNGTLFMYEWASNWIKEVKLDEDGHILKINPFLDSMEFIRPISMQFGPDGSLYVLEWGSGFWGDNDDARVVRIDYVNWIDFQGQGVSRPPATAVSAESSSQGALPSQPVLYPPYPNPFNPTVQIRFVLPGRMAVRLEVFDILGQRVDIVVNEMLDAGSHAVRFDRVDLASGVYIVRLATSGEVLVRRMVLLR